MRGKEQSSGVSIVSTEDKNGEIIKHVEKEELEDAMLKYSKENFLQATNTPFCQQPLISEFPMDGKHPNYDHIYNGTYVPPINSDNSTKLLLQHMQCPSFDHTLPAHFTSEDYSSGWGKAR